MTSTELACHQQQRKKKERGREKKKTEGTEKREINISTVFCLASCGFLWRVRKEGEKGSSYLQQLLGPLDAQEKEGKKKKERKGIRWKTSRGDLPWLWRKRCMQSEIRSLFVRGKKKKERREKGEKRNPACHIRCHHPARPSNSFTFKKKRKKKKREWTEGDDSRLFSDFVARMGHCQRKERRKEGGGDKGARSSRAALRA